MLFDLLLLTGIGQNMELLASLHQASQNLLQNHGSAQKAQVAPAQTRSRPQRCRAHQEFQHKPKERPSESGIIMSPLNHQCKPLDLTVKNAPEEQARQSSNKSRLHRQTQLDIKAHDATPNGLGPSPEEAPFRQRRKRPAYRNHQNPQPLSATRLISSSTSPSSCSRSASSVSASSNESKSSNEVISSSTTAINTASNTKLAAAASSSNTPNNNNNNNNNSSINKRQKHKNLKSHLCQECGRSFSRSDMLTRHSRLHSGLKPYQCSKCKQVFSRSDHLSTHERTHTGEKPYQCERCSYSACRRDMITRHMRTHSVGSTDRDKAIRKRSPTVGIDHLHLIEKVESINREFNFEQDVSTSFDGHSEITEEENNLDDVELEAL